MWESPPDTTTIFIVRLFRACSSPWLSGLFKTFYFFKDNQQLSIAFIINNHVASVGGERWSKYSFQLF